MQLDSIDSEEPSPDRIFRLRLLTITGIAALWRLGVLVVDKWHQPLLPNDSLYYSAQARQLVDGIWFREIFVDQPGAEHGPLTSTLLALVSWVDEPVPWQRLVTVMCGIATVFVIGLLGRRVGGTRPAATRPADARPADARPAATPPGDAVGLCAAAIAAIYPNLWMNDGLVMSESVSVLMVSLVMLAMLRLLDAPTESGAALVGLLAGLAALSRSELALLTPAAMVLVLLVRRRDRVVGGGRSSWRLVAPSLAVGLVSLATVAPWVLFNQARFSEPVTLTTNDGTTLLGSYCSRTFSGPDTGGWSLFCITDDPDYAMDEEPSVRSARQRDLAIEFARDNMGQLPKVVVARIARTLDLYGLDSLVDQDVGEERWRWASWAGIVSWWVLAPAALIGAMKIRRARGDGTGPNRWTLWVLGCPVVSVFVITVVFYGAHRIRSSLEPTVVVLAAVTLAAAVGRLRRGSARVAEVS